MEQPQIVYDDLHSSICESTCSSVTTYPKIVINEEVDTSEPVVFKPGCVFNIPMVLDDNVTIQDHTVFNASVIVKKYDRYRSVIFNGPVICECDAEFIEGVVFNSDVVFKCDTTLDGVIFAEYSNIEFQGEVRIGTVTQEGKLFEFPDTGKSCYNNPMLLTHMSYGGERLLFKYPFKIHPDVCNPGFIWYFADSDRILFEYLGRFADKSNAVEFLEGMCDDPNIKSSVCGFVENIIKHRNNFTGPLDVGFISYDCVYHDSWGKYCILDMDAEPNYLMPVVYGGTHECNVTWSDARMIGCFADYIFKAAGVECTQVSLPEHISIDHACIFNAPLKAERHSKFNKNIILNVTAEFEECCHIRSIISNNYVVELPLMTYVDGVLNRYHNVTIDGATLQYSSHIIWNTEGLLEDLEYDPINFMWITDDGVFFTVIRENYYNDRFTVRKYDLKSYINWLSTILDAKCVREIKRSLKKFLDAFASNDFSGVQDLLIRNAVILTPSLWNVNR